MKKEVIRKFCSEIMSEENRKNKVTISGVNTTLITAALNCAFVNESCKSTGLVSKSQVIYRKLKDKTIMKCQDAFRKESIKFMKTLKVFSRNRKFILSCDESEEDYYGELNKGEKNTYIHAGCDNPKANYHYYYIAIAVTSNDGTRYILDGKILRRGEYIEDVVYQMVKFIKDYIPIDFILFDRGFGWGIIYKLKELKVNYLIFWKKQGSWYKKYFEELEDGEHCVVHKKYKYNRDKTNYEIDSDFIIIKQHKYKNKKYNWIFATNLNLDKAESYVKRYKKRWGIETIFRVNDDIRIYTTSTDPVIRHFLFLFTCFVYNVWKFFQIFIGKNFTRSSFCTVFMLYLGRNELIHPIHYESFEKIADKLNWLY